MRIGCFLIVCWRFDAQGMVGVMTCQNFLEEDALRPGVLPTSALVYHYCSIS